MTDVEAFGNKLAELDAISDLLVAVTGQLIGTMCHLGKTNIVIDRTTTLAALEAQEADFDGYAAEAVTWGVASQDSQGRAGVPGIVGEFRPTGSVTPNTVYNGWLKNGAGLLLLAWRVNGTTGKSMGSAIDFYIPTPFYRPSFAGEIDQA